MAKYAHFMGLAALIVMIGVDAASQSVVNEVNTSLTVNTAVGQPLETIAMIKPTPNKIGPGFVAIPTVVTSYFSPKYPDQAKITATGPVPVFIQIQFVQVKKIDGVEESFTSDFYFNTLWPDASICTPGVDPTDTQFDPGNSWTPNFDFTNINGQAQSYVSNPYSVVKQPNYTLVDAYPNDPPRDVMTEGWGDCWISYNQRFTGAFSSKLKLEEFPFDKQNATIAIESSLYDITQVQFFYNKNIEITAVPSDLAILEWDIHPSNDEAVSVKVSKHFYPAYDQTYSRFELQLTVARQPGYYINKVVVGVMLLGTMNFLVYSLAVPEADRQMGTISIFLAMVAYLFVTSSDLPKVATSTRIDKFMTLNFSVVFITHVIHAFLYLLRESEDAITVVKKSEKRSDKRSKAKVATNVLPTPITVSHDDIPMDILDAPVQASVAELPKEAEAESESDDDDDEVEEPLVERFLPWRHLVLTRKFDLLITSGGYICYLVACLVVMFGGRK